MATRSGNPGDSVAGAVLGVAPAELQQADGHAVAACRPERVTLASGTQAWAYVDARDAVPGS